MQAIANNILRAFHGDPAVKAKYVQRFAAHRAADQVIQGTGFENGRGCFVGCTLDAYDHDRFPTELGWPTWLALLADTIFEGLPKTEAPQFGSDLLEAVPVGVDLEPVKARFLLTIQRRNLARLDGNTNAAAVECRTAVQAVIDWLSAGATDESARSAAESAAESAARSAARSAAESAAWSAARSAAWSAAESAAWSAARSAAESAARSAAESAARSAAWSAARSAAWSAARSAEFQTQRDDLLAIIRECGNV